MPVGPIKDVAAAAPRGRALLGLDVGARTIGLALAPPPWGVVVPLRTHRRAGKGGFARDVAAIQAAMAAHGAGGLVVGWPLTLDGRAGPRAQSTRDFAVALHAALPGDAWVALADERLTTAAARGALGPGARLGRAKARGHLDALAAAAILEGAVGALL
jgi:putative holliday junction resolvase